MRHAKIVIALVSMAIALVVVAVIFRSLALAVMALLTFAGIMAVVVVQALPSLRYRQSVKYDHSFITNVLGQTSESHPGPAASDRQSTD